jgi:predicted nucleotidyltransferase
VSTATDEPGSASPALAAVEGVVEAARTMARDEPSIRAIALVGSCARGTAGAESDIDLVVLTFEPERLCRRRDWFTRFGPVDLVGQRQFGAVTERRLRRDDGVEIEVGLTAASWADTDPLDGGTARVVREGFIIVFDPDGLLARLEAAVTASAGHDH